MDKRIVLCIVALVASVCVAQSQDTIKYGDSVYMYSSMSTPYYTIPPFLSAVDFDECPWTEGHPIAKRFYSEEGVLVYGVAIAISNYIFYEPTGVYNPAYADSMDNVVNQRRTPGCFIATLYQKTGDQMLLVDTVQWHYPPVDRIVEFSESRQFPTPYDSTDTVVTSYYHMFEFYFKEPHRMTDTFYVGKWEQSENYIWNEPGCAFADKDSSIIIDFYDWLIPDSSGDDNWIYFPDWDNPNDYIRGFPPLAYSWLNLTSYYPDYDLNYTGFCSYIHPILQPRYDICRAPGKPWMTARTGTSATFEWGEVEDSAMLVVGDYLGDPDTMAAIALGPGSTGYTVAGLEPGTYYGAWLRQRCRWQMQDSDSTRWSDWSERVIFSTDLEGIAAAEPVPMSVYPNPARGSFTVETEDLPACLTLYNAQGTEIYAVNLRTQRTTIGIADLPKGVYFAVLTTAGGTATRRVVHEP